MLDPFLTLGLPHDADEVQIKAAYRKLAKRHHPDLNPGDPRNADRFKEVSAAYSLLQDPAKRAAMNARSGAAARSEGPAPKKPADPPKPKAEKAEPPPRSPARDEIIQDLLKNLRTVRKKAFGGDGADQTYQLVLDGREAKDGATKRLTLKDGRTLDVRIPPGVSSGQVIRLKGQGEAGSLLGSAGDALVELQVGPHPALERDGLDVWLTLPVSLKEAVLGTKIAVPTWDGEVQLTVPKRATTGTVLRLKGKGIAGAGQSKGDQYVTLEVALPEVPDPALERFLEGWTPVGPYDPRGKAGI